ncbi:hypothetical protein ACIRG4_18475 [Streptomyces sp. NPDC102395]|uniref:hypothetical protein n=1 Tax=Streptomyces sp. NPDC102395 TaxID=3366168 RepID=UPI00381A3946
MSCGPCRAGPAPGPGRGNERPCRGRLHVEAGDEPGGSRLTVELHTQHTEGGQVDHGLRQALSGLKSTVEGAER